MTNSIIRRVAAVLFIIIIYVDKNNGFFKDSFKHIDVNQSLLDNLRSNERAQELVDYISELFNE